VDVAKLLERHLVAGRVELRVGGGLAGGEVLVAQELAEHSLHRRGDAEARGQGLLEILLVRPAYVHQGLEDPRVPLLTTRLQVEVLVLLLVDLAQLRRVVV